MTIHIPVMLAEVCDVLQITTHKKLKILDVTYGGGGYTKKFLEYNHDVYAIDRDSSLQPVISNFYNIKFSELKQVFNINFFDCIVADLGVSTDQLLNLDRGFSFLSNTSLDMRMGLCKISALNIIKKYSEKRLIEIFFKFGEEKYARKIAATIVQNRAKINTASDLVKLIIPIIRDKRRIHPATKIFQALRIEVNQELAELENLTKVVLQLLKINGIFAAVTFHSLEDRIIKHSFKAREKWQNIGRKFATKEEINLNPSARSAILRWGQKICAYHD